MTLEVPGAVLTYDVRPGSDDAATPLILVGSPMAAAGFVTLAGHFADRTVVTYDPRHSGERSKLTSDDEATPDTHADDIHRVITAAVGDRPVDLMGTSGGAVNALALVAAHPDLVGTLVAHEPPLVSQLPDRVAALAATRDIQTTYERDGLGPAMAKFLALIMHQGEVSTNWVEQPAPDPAAFGLPAEDDGSRDDPMLGRNNLINITAYQPDYAALRSSATRVIIAVGAESEGELARRGGEAVAAALGVEAEIFPSHHGGFLGGEYGQTGDPDAFAAKLRAVLSS
jgi:pimeloyl-ACP methyl ester carboxylesterase